MPIGGRERRQDASDCGECARTISEEHARLRPTSTVGERGGRDQTPLGPVRDGGKNGRRKTGTREGRWKGRTRAASSSPYIASGTRGAAPRTRRASEASARGGQASRKSRDGAAGPRLVRPHRNKISKSASFLFVRLVRKALTGAAATVCRHSRTRDMPLIEEMADVSDGPSGMLPPTPTRYAAFTERRSGEGVGGAARVGARGERRRGRARRRRSGPVRRAERARFPDVHADWRSEVTPAPPSPAPPATPARSRTPRRPNGTPSIARNSSTPWASFITPRRS